MSATAYFEPAEGFSATGTDQVSLNPQPLPVSRWQSRVLRDALLRL